MKFRALIAGMIALAISFTPQAGALPLKAMASDDLKVEVLPPDRGTVTFIAQTGENPIPGVEIKIDSETKGFTSKDGKLKVEWLSFGDHTWRAMYDGEEVYRGDFKIPNITDVEIMDCGMEKEGKKIEKFSLDDEVIWGIIIKNNGTTPIDHFDYVWGCTPKEPKIEVIQPNIPSSLVEGLYKALIHPEVKYEFDKQKKLEPGERIEVIRLDGEKKNLEQGEAFKEVMPVRPGEILVIYKEYGISEWAKEEAESAFEKKIAGMRFSGVEIVMDEKNAIAHITVDKAERWPIKVEDLEMKMNMEGPGDDLIEIFIDGELCGSIIFEYELIKAE